MPLLDAPCLPRAGPVPGTMHPLDLPQTSRAPAEPVSCPLLPHYRRPFHMLIASSSGCRWGRNLYSLRWQGGFPRSAAAGTGPTLRHVACQIACLVGVLVAKKYRCSASLGPPVTVSALRCAFNFFLFYQSTLAWSQGAHGVVVSHPLRMRKALGSIPSVSMHRKREATNSFYCVHLPSHSVAKSRVELDMRHSCRVARYSTTG